MIRLRAGSFVGLLLVWIRQVGHRGDFFQPVRRDGPIRRSHELRLAGRFNRWRKTRRFLHGRVSQNTHVHTACAYHDIMHYTAVGSPSGLGLAMVTSG
jgi:hypothetical protein